MYASRTDRPHSQGGRDTHCRCDYCLPRQRWSRSSEHTQWRAEVEMEFILADAEVREAQELAEAMRETQAALVRVECAIAENQRWHGLEIQYGSPWNWGEEHECGCCRDCCEGNSWYWHERDLVLAELERLHEHLGAGVSANDQRKES